MRTAKSWQAMTKTSTGECAPVSLGAVSFAASAILASRRFMSMLGGVSARHGISKIHDGCRSVSWITAKRC
jgi:hypothetical protein